MVKIYGTADEVVNITNLEDILVNGIEVIVTFNLENFFSISFNMLTQKYECKFIPSNKFAEYNTYTDIYNSFFPMITTFL